jgi:hypothetical protein
MAIREQSYEKWHAAGRRPEEMHGNVDRMLRFESNRNRVNMISNPSDRTMPHPLFDRINQSRNSTWFAYTRAIIIFVTFSVPLKSNSV